MRLNQSIRLFNLKNRSISCTFWQRICSLVVLLTVCGCGAASRPYARTLSQIDAADDKNYYEAVTGLSSSALKEGLHQIIRHSLRLNYNQIWAKLKYTDQDPANTDNVIMVYTGRSLSNTAVGDEESGLIEWNREHVWAKARGFPRADMPAYSDLHHLRPCEASINRARGSMMFGDATDGQELAAAPGAYIDINNALFQPPANVKGDIARILFYMDVRYQGDVVKEADLRLVETLPADSVRGVDALGNGYFANVSTLMRWHEEDPVNDQERARNARVFEVQRNRNPFVDHPEFANLIYPHLK